MSPADAVPVMTGGVVGVTVVITTCTALRGMTTGVAGPVLDAVTVPVPVFIYLCHASSLSTVCNLQDRTLP